MTKNTNKKTAHLPAAARELIETFAVSLAEVFKNDARERLVAALGLTESKPSSKPTAHRQSAHAAPRASTGSKRDPAELERIGARLLAYVRQHPGERIEQIAKAIGTTSTDLKLPMTKLLGAKSVKKKGERRSTKYFSAQAA